MEISNILEITPELKGALLQILASAKALEKQVGENNFEINIVPGGHSHITIYDRHEGKLGFYTHELMEDGTYKFDFINSGHTPEADMFEKAFDRKYHPERFEDESEDPE